MNVHVLTIARDVQLARRLADAATPPGELAQVDQMIAASREDLRKFGVDLSNPDVAAALVVALDVCHHRERQARDSLGPNQSGVAFQAQLMAFAMLAADALLERAGEAVQP